MATAIHGANPGVIPRVNPGVNRSGSPLGNAIGRHGYVGTYVSKPIAHIPMWKWEGYPEYVARKNKASLIKNISHLIETEKTDNNNWISFGDSTGTVIPYYKSWLLVQYCLDIRKMTYTQLLKDTTQEALLTQHMMKWYESKDN